MFKIMIVEDDPKIRKILNENLIKWKFDVFCVEDFNHIFQCFLDSKPHLVLLDINLPCFDGFYWCNQIRQVSKVPILFLSSRNTNMDMIMAMNMGGDDFVQKPFSLEVLMAKIHALLRRTYSYAHINSSILEYKGLVLNLKDNHLIYNKQHIELTKNEYKIMYVLMKNNNQIVSREKIMRNLWEDESFVDDNTLTVNINRLRKKLNGLGLEALIQTKKGQGYTLK